ncbi:hypothetical protein E1295_36665 [Nonomuraea mesophila]|uniref:Uncharacterized protein n=1 Tax=Nonomuraea mesophila TaxID=2530382 RepID=A0A4R5EK80_9ACTN|nr:hypothetical protein E1295_36665 [Nonomuraea mesophila]
MSELICRVAAAMTAALPTSMIWPRSRPVSASISGDEPRILLPCSSSPPPPLRYLPATLAAASMAAMRSL